MLVTLILSLSLQVDSAFGGSCGVAYDITKYLYKKNICDQKGQTIIVQEFFADNDKLASEDWLESSGRVYKRIGYDSSGNTRLFTWKYFEKSYIKTTFMPNSAELINYKYEKLSKSNQTIREWKYKEGKLKWIDEFSFKKPKQILKREFIEENFTYLFTYRDKSRYDDEVKSFIAKDEKGRVIRKYNYSFDGDIEAIIQKQFTGHELSQMLVMHRNQNRVPVAIIDSGFDLTHPQITPYLINSKSERWGDKDIDGNGLPGDIIGWSYDEQNRQGPNINEPVIIGGFKPFPISHGTHVASIAMKGQTNASLIGFAGDVASPQYLRIISRELKQKNIRLSNMSWGFKEQGAPFTPRPESYSALKELITHNPQTLFTVAAGNSGWDLDAGQLDFPASYAYNNLFVIGSLNEDNYHWSNDSTLIPARYKGSQGSNIGKVSVDAFAPGKEVNGAQLGGGMIRKSGTSMASPYALNSIISVFTILPYLTTLELKELMMKSVGFVKNGLPCVSEGFIHPKRSLKAASLLKRRPELSIEEAILLARKNKDDFYSGEVDKSFEELKKIWLKVDKSLKINQEKGLAL